MPFTHEEAKYAVITKYILLKFLFNRAEMRQKWCFLQQFLVKLILWSSLQCLVSTVKNILIPVFYYQILTDANKDTCFQITPNGATCSKGHGCLARLLVRSLTGPFLTCPWAGNLLLERTRACLNKPKAFVTNKHKCISINQNVTGQKHVYMYHALAQGCFLILSL